MKNYPVYEGEDTVHNKLKTTPKINVGDTIEYITNNQMGYEKYTVILGENGEKELSLIDSYDHAIKNNNYESEGGKRRKSRKARKSKKTRKSRKTHKSRKSRK